MLFCLHVCMYTMGTVLFWMRTAPTGSYIWMPGHLLGRNYLGRIGECGLVGGLSLGVDLQSPCYSVRSLAVFCCGWESKLSASAPVLRLTTCCYAPYHDGRGYQFSGTIRHPRIPSSISCVDGGVCHSYRKITDMHAVPKEARRGCMISWN